MSVLIKGAELPASCLKCWFAKENTFNCIPRWFSEETAKKLANSRLDDCPLVEVKDEVKEGMNKQEAYKIVLEDLKKESIFTGVYDAVNGSPEFMYGVALVMEQIAEIAGEQDAFVRLFYRNMTISQAKAEVEHGQRKS